MMAGLRRAILRKKASKKMNRFWTSMMMENVTPKCKLSMQELEKEMMRCLILMISVMETIICSLNQLLNRRRLKAVIFRLSKLENTT